MKILKNIIVATDFSEASRVAYEYGLDLANRLNAALKVVHAYQPFVSTSHIEMMDVGPDLSDLQTFNEERMARFVQEAEDGTTLVKNRVKITTSTQLGFAPDVLVRLSKDPSVDLLILGTSGEKDWLDRLLGSVSVEVSRKAHCPVLLVPKNADFMGIHNILYAAALDSANPRAIRLMMDWTQYLKSSLHFVHVGIGETEVSQRALKSLFDTYIKQYSPDFLYSFTALDYKNILQGLWDYSDRNDVDMLVVVSYHRDFWESLKHHSISKDMALRTHLPILFIHSDISTPPPV